MFIPDPYNNKPFRFRKGERIKCNVDYSANSGIFTIGHEFTVSDCDLKYFNLFDDDSRHICVPYSCMHLFDYAK